MDNSRRTNRVAVCGLLTALALIFSYVEAMMPLDFAMPGIKLGLANIAVVCAMYLLGLRYAFFVNVVRICVSALLFGNPFSALYALSGGLLSFIFMAMLKKTGLFSTCGVSMAGGVFHNLGQLIIAAIVLETSQIFYYFPVLILSGTLTGVINGVVCTIILSRLEKLARNI